MRRQRAGFTLTELLIALAILGVIATFTIPKVIQSQQDQKFKAIGKEAAAMISGAYQAYKMNNDITANTSATDLTPYMNFVNVDASTELDDTTGSTSFTCDGNLKCFKLHNGAILETNYSNKFNGTSNLHGIFFYLDPDGKYSGSATGPGKSVVFFLYFNGKLRTLGTVDAGSSTFFWGSDHAYNPDPSLDPSWFSWN